MLKTRVGVAPDSWGVIFVKDGKQMPWDQVLDEMAEAGFEGVELGPWGFFPNTMETLHPELEKRGLDLASATLPVEPVNEEKLKASLRTVDDMCKLLLSFEDARHIVLLPEVIAKKDWDAYCDGCQKIYEYAKAAYGVTCVMHPHLTDKTYLPDPENWLTIETEEQIERFLNDTGVPLCLDTGHHVCCGGDPVAFYRKWRSRIPFLHIKDCNPVVREKMLRENLTPVQASGEGIFCGPGEGMIDFNAFRSELEDAQYEGWLIIEHDCYPAKPGYPLPAAKKDRLAMKELCLG